MNHNAIIIGDSDNPRPWDDLEESIDILVMNLVNKKTNYIDCSDAIWKLVKPYLDENKR